MRATLVTGGNTFDVGNVLRFKGNHFSADKFIPGNLIPTPVRGRLRTSRRNLQGIARIDPNQPILISRVRVTLQKTPRIAKLNLVNSVENNGVPL